MAPTLSSPPLKLVRAALVVSAAAVFGVGVADGCGGGKGTSTHGFGGTGPASSGSVGTGEGQGGMVGLGGFGGTIFKSTATSSGSTGGSFPGTCDPNPTKGPFQWVTKNNDDGGQNGLAVAVDGSGNVIVVGQYSLMTTFTLGSLPALPTDAHNAIFVAKLSPTGTPLWAKAFPTVAPFPSNATIYSTARAVAADDQGGIYVAGDFAGTLVFGSTMITSVANFFGDAFIAKLDTNGDAQWAVRLGDDAATTPSNGGGTQTPHGVALHKNPTGFDVAVVGEFEETLDLHNGTILKAAANGTVAAGFVAVFRSGDGSTEFGMQFGDGTVEQSTRAVAFDPSGDVLVTGNTAGVISFPGGPMLTPTATMQAAFVAKVKGDGSTTTWAKVYGADTASGEGIGADASGDVLVTGDHSGDIDFGGGALSNPNGPNVFVAKLDPTGTEIWANTYGDSMAQHAHGLVVDAMGRTFVAGEYTGHMTFGKTKLTSAGGDDIWVAKIDSHGCSVWAQSFGDPKEQAANGIALDPMGDPVIGGTITGTVAFGMSMESVIDNIGDVFVAKFGP
jgi:hypothetical protein